MNTKWSNLPYWLKGGLILLAVGVTCTIIFYFGDWRAGQLVDWLMMLTIMPFAFAGFFVGGTGAALAGLAEQYVFYFALGSLLGWVYGKIKK